MFPSMSIFNDESWIHAFVSSAQRYPTKFKDDASNGVPDRNHWSLKYWRNSSSNKRGVLECSSFFKWNSSFMILFHFISFLMIGFPYFFFPMSTVLRRILFTFDSYDWLVVTITNLSWFDRNSFCSLIRNSSLFKGIRLLGFSRCPIRSLIFSFFTLPFSVKDHSFSQICIKEAGTRIRTGPKQGSSLKKDPASTHGQHIE